MKAGDADPASVVLALHREDLALTRRTVETGRVQISTTVKEREELVDQLLKTEGYEIERVAIGQRVGSPPAMREEGDTIILPIIEEVLVVEKHLILREEIRLRRVVTEERHQETVTLRSEEASISRVPPGEDPGRSLPAAAGQTYPPEEQNHD
jgi:uncharacterized protein (TIGR02271 family)